MKNKFLICCGFMMMFFSMSAQQKTDGAVAVQKQDRAPRELFVESSELRLEQMEREKFQIDQQQKINEFLKLNENWVLFSIRIDESALKENSYRKDDLLVSVTQESADGMIYAETENTVLLTSRDESHSAFIFGDKSTNQDGKIVVQSKGYCATCSSTVVFERINQGDEIVLRFQDQDEDKQDVFYLFTFKK
jgi:hypothetical protein